MDKSGWPDSNRRPHGPQPCALPAALQPGIIPYRTVRRVRRDAHARGDEPPQSSPGDACGIALAAPSRTSLIPWGAPTLRGRYGAVRRIGWNRTIGLPVPNGVRCHCATIRSPPASAGEPCVHFPVPAQPGAVEPGLRRRLCYGREGNPCLRRNSRIRTDGLALPKRARCLLRHVPFPAEGRIHANSPPRPIADFPNPIGHSDASGALRSFLWTWRGSNPLPSRCERDALPIELQARGFEYRPSPMDVPYRLAGTMAR